VQFILGREKFLRQQPEEAIAHWKDAFHRDAAYRQQLISGLSPLVPAAFFLENFDVDQKTMPLLRAAYKESPDQEGYRNILLTYANMECREAQAATGQKAVGHWLIAHSCFAELNDDRKALAAAKAAVKENPMAINARLALGTYLYDHGDFEGAAEHLTWCVRRRPDDANLRRRAETAIANRGRPSAKMAREEEPSTVR
jgi:thioredoxin-like negative regulator of GroEL